MTTAGPNNPGTQANDSSVGTFAWNNPTNAATDNDTYTTSNVTSSSPSQILRLTNFGLSLTGTVTSVDGITVEIKKRKTGAFGNNVDLQVQLTKDASTGTGTDKKDTTTNWPTTAAYVGYGGSSDLWGTTWTESEIESSNFGVLVRATGTDFNFSQAEIDTVRITIDYTTSGGATVTSTMMLMGCGT